jgi:hypothetical protein
MNYIGVLTLYSFGSFQLILLITSLVFILLVQSSSIHDNKINQAEVIYIILNGLITIKVRRNSLFFIFFLFDFLFLFKNKILIKIFKFILIHIQYSQ